MKYYGQNALGTAALGAFVKSALDGARFRTKMSRGGKGPIRNRGGKKVTDSKIATNQYDVRGRYYKKRMPRRKKKQWKQFQRKVNAVLNKQIAPTYFLFRTTTQLNSVQDAQDWASCMLYTANTPDPNNDLGRIAIGLMGNAGNQIGTKYRFEAAVLDLLIRNTGSTTACVDIYTIYCRKDVPDNYVSPFVLISQLDDTANADTQGDPKINEKNIGYTPFHNPMFCSYYKIQQKRTLILGAGEVSEVQMRDAKNRKMYGIDFVGKSSCAGWTKGYLLCTRGAFDGVITPATSIGLAYTRSYTLREISDKTWTSAKV